MGCLKLGKTVAVSYGFKCRKIIFPSISATQNLRATFFIFFKMENHALPKKITYSKTTAIPFQIVALLGAKLGGGDAIER